MVRFGIVGMAWYGEYLRACKMLECSYSTYMSILNEQKSLVSNLVDILSDCAIIHIML